MVFNLADLGRFLYLALFRGPTVEPRLRVRRTFFLLLFALLYPVVEAAIWAGLLADEVLFARYRGQGVREPVFIVGSYRSGTTFLHRLLAKDSRTFTTMRLWEILFAPSIVSRQVGRALSALDRWLGGPVGGLLAQWETGWQEEFTAHSISFGSPEEDEYLLLHIWSTMTVWLYAGLLDEMAPYVRFDARMSPRQRQRIMGFYARCVQRHLHAHHHGSSDARHYLSKSPPFTAKIGSIYETFPDAKVILLVRSPLSVVPSFISFVERSWKIIGGPVGEEVAREKLCGLIDHWYSDPLEQLAQAPQGSFAVVRYDDLVRHPARAVTELYARFGFDVGPAYADVLQEATARSRRRSSKHSYALPKVGLTREQIVDRYHSVFDRYGFDTCGGTSGAGAQVH